MSSKLETSLDALRAVMPTVNAAADQATGIVRMVEHVLVEELKVGISAESPQYLEYRRRDLDDESSRATLERVEQHIAFGRVRGTYCIHLKEVTFHQGEYGILLDRVFSEETPWSQCDREMRLRLFAFLPGLIESIVEQAKALAKEGRATAAKVKELLEDEDSTKPLAEDSNPTDRFTTETKNSTANAKTLRLERRRLKS
jgi:hypothetical protein